ncbi:MAG: MBL fold metallo-hydrolase, partial [Alphaproteobacteria bacterium]|nr:MBL fold metallo-hydrolase [Alphaproteobacteria bacterium]
MALTFETLGNTTVQFAVDGEPILATDPWLSSTCYFGSWALDHALSDQQIQNVQNSQYIWVSHGHPDHLHTDSLEMIPKGKIFLVPEHYDQDIVNSLTEKSFKVEILPYRRWRRLHPKIEVMCIDNENQDAVLIVRLGDALVIDMNDSPSFGEDGFVARLAARHQNDRVFLLMLCSIDADMRNFVDTDGHRTMEDPKVLKPGAVWEAARRSERIGA